MAKSVEIWEDIEGYEGLYMVSNLGRVKSLTYRHSLWGREVIAVANERILTPTDNGHGYKIVDLKRYNERKNHYVHRLVAKAFIEQPEGKNYINHLDHNRGNNQVSNLQWCTQKENIDYSKHLLCKPKTSCKSSNTGEKYITYRKKEQRFRVNIPKYKIDKDKFTPATFNISKDGETNIITSLGEYVVIWNFTKIKKGILDDYKIQKVNQFVIDNQFKYNKNKVLIN